MAARSPAPAGLFPLPPSPSPVAAVHSPSPTPSAIAHSPTPSPAISPSISDVPASAPVSQSEAALYRGSMGLVLLSVMAVAALVA